MNNNQSGPSPVRRVAVGAAVLLGLGFAAAGFAAQAQAFFSAQPDPGFTQAQAAQGKAAYGENCASCHGGALDDGQFGVALKGAVFKSHWSGQPPEAMLTYIQTKMPPAGPGTLSSSTYAAIQAYILQSNGVAARGAGVAAAPPATPPVDPDRRMTSDDAPRRIPVPLPGRDAVYEAVVAQRAAKLAALKPVTDAMLRDPAAEDWLMWRRTYGTLAFSPLKQVTQANVNQLRTAWSWSLPVSQNETTPLVQDGVMFIASGATVQALDAATGDLLWQYIRPLADSFAGGRGNRLKALAIYQGWLYVPTPDGHLIALETKTGKVAWDHEVLTDAHLDRKGQAEGVALHMDGGPIVANGKVIIGVSLGIANARGGCFIVGLDAATGREIWRFHTVDQSPVGKDSWNGAPVEERYGGGVWTVGSFDPALNLVYFGIGNNYNVSTLLVPHARKGASNDALYTNATVALNPDTGKLAWHYQHVSREVWDLDWSFEQSLVTVSVNGKPRDLVVTAGKMALFDAMDRKTGQYVFSKDLGLQNLVIAIDPKTGRKTTNPALEPEPGKAKLLCPGSSGARSWPTTAFNPQTKILYVPMIEACADYTWTPRTAAQTAAGGLDMRFAPRRRPDSDGNLGRIQAINLETKEVVWTHRQRAPIASSMLATAGGLVFHGSLDRTFNAYDEATGKLLWSTRLNASPSSSPVTYGVNGRQYIAVVAGGGGSFDATGRGMAPELDNPAGGTTVSVFELPQP